MSEVLLVRHAQAHSNVGDLSFGNEHSPLTLHGLTQVENELRPVLTKTHGIYPEVHMRPVLTSTFKRTKETAHEAGFQVIHNDSVLNESGFDELQPNEDIFGKHIAERWAPQETRDRALELLQKIVLKDFEYKLCFTHGMFIASLLLELDALEISHTTKFDTERGYIPLQASVTSIKL